MKTLRKSLNGHKEHHISSPVSPLPSLSKPILSVQPPKKVIKALGPHRASAPQELSFEKGDFFHVINDVGHGQWYEAHNPMTGARGLVPCSLFEEFARGGTPKTPHTATVPLVTVPRHTPTPSITSPKIQAYFAVVLHDFEAERADELDAKAGDTISVVAQSNREWFVAKPIGRLGRPGLIPVAFVEVRDPNTGTAIKDINTLIESGALPRVEEWKRSVMTYKANSISLGVLEDSTKLSSSLSRTSPNRPTPPVTIDGPSPHSYQHDLQQHSLPDQTEYVKALPKGVLMSAEVQSFHFEMDEYWFRVHAIFQPYDPQGSTQLPPAKELVLFRSYNDFYDFQVSLLNSFPHEAGRPDKSSRILPFMPGPADTVDNEITITRRQELDEYLKQLAELRFTNRYIFHSQLVREFLAIKPGDAEQEVEPRAAELWALPPLSDEQGFDHGDGVQSRMSHLSVSDVQGGKSDQSEYEDDYRSASRQYDDHPGSYRSSDQSSYPRHASQDMHSRHMPPPHGHVRPDSATSLHKNSKISHNPTHSRSNSRTNSPMPGHERYPSLDVDSHYPSSYSRSSLVSSHEPSPVSMRSSQAASVATSTTSMSGRSRSQSSATLNTPPISASNPQTAFVKIKIFDSATDDLVAIRVHPQVTHSQLMGKVQARLGGNIMRLSYRDSTGDVIGLEGDEELKRWLDSTERLVLFAD